MHLIIKPDGTIKTLYSEALDFSAFGVPSYSRASHVESSGSEWIADMSPSGGPMLGTFAKRSEALAAEVEWLERNVL